MGIGFLEGLKVTLKTARRKPVTGQYPEPDKRLPVQERFMGFPALTWDYEVGEPYCTGCMVCVRNCPTQCMSATMTDNPKAAEGESRRRKIIEDFEINLGRCILCGICVDVCNFDAIEMSHEHELSKYERNGNRVDLPQLLEMGKQYQAQVNWTPAQPEKNSGVPLKREAPAGADAEAQPKSEMTKEERLAAARARAAVKRQTADAASDGTSEAAPQSQMSKEERLAAARARAVAKRQAAGQVDGVTADAASPETRPNNEMTKEERVAAARARAVAKRQPAQSDGQPADADLLSKPKSEMSKEERVVAARARARAKRETNGDTDASENETDSEV